MKQGSKKKENLFSSSIEVQEEEEKELKKYIKAGRKDTIGGNGAGNSQVQVSGTAIKKPFSKIKWQNRSLSLANFLPPAVIEKFLKSEKSLITDIKYIFDCVYSNLSFLFNRYSSSSSLRDDFPPPSPSPSLLHLPYSPPSSSPDASLSSSLSHLHSRVLSVFHILSTIINVFNQFGASSSVSSNNLMSSSPSSSSSATSNTPLSHVQSYNKIFSLLSAPLLHSIDSSSNAILVCISYFSSPFPSSLSNLLFPSLSSFYTSFLLPLPLTPLPPSSFPFLC